MSSVVFNTMKYRNSESFLCVDVNLPKACCSTLGALNIQRSRVILLLFFAAEVYSLS